MFHRLLRQNAESREELTRFRGQTHPASMLRLLDQLPNNWFETIRTPHPSPYVISHIRTVTTALFCLRLERGILDNGLERK